MQRSLKEVAEFIGGRIAGDPATTLDGVASIDSACPGDLVFVEEESHLARALGSGASAVLVGSFAAEQPRAKPLLFVDNPRLAFARAATLLYAKPNRSAGVHPSAVVHASATLGAGVSVETHAAIAGNAVVGKNSWIGSGAVIGEGVRIGEKCEIFPNVTIYPGTTLGDRVTIHAGAVLGSDGFGYVRDPKTGRYEKFPQIGSLQIEDDVEIGANTTIDRGALDATVIRRGTKLDNLIHVGHNVEIGRDVVIAAQTGISGSSVVEDGVVMGGQVGIGDHARIESGVILGGQCGVLPKKVVRGKGMLFWGTPVRPVKDYLKQLAALARLAKKG
jgi:UDP-3-O-[3-hydroxymyristoyl] glucosamine N-acyltransferase